MEKVSAELLQGNSSIVSSTSEDTFHQDDYYYEDDDSNFVGVDSGSVPVDAAAAGQQSGSTVLGAALNFTNSIVGAGCIGYGGAMADSGGLVSVMINFFFALLCKASYDLLIELGIEFHVTSYEALGYRALGPLGRIAVIWSKAIFGFGGMVSYMVVARDNFSPALVSLFGLETTTTSNTLSNGSLVSGIVGDKIWMTLMLCTCVMLPLSLMRDISFLQYFSSAKIAIFAAIIVTVIYFYFDLPPSVDATSLTFSQKWLEVRPGVIKSTGTFVYGYVAQHTVHLVFRSLKEPVRNLNGFKGVSTISTALALSIFLCVSIFPYMTFYEKTKSDLFDIYPAVPLVDWARILVSVAMLFTFPINLFSLREMLVQSLAAPTAKRYLPRDCPPTEYDSLLGTEAMESTDFSDVEQGVTEESPVYLDWTHHAGLTIFLWALSLTIALTPASLGDVLNLVGCISGALIAFVLPAAFAIRLRGYNTTLNSVLFLTGCFVGCFGTYFGFKDMVSSWKTK